MKDIRFQSKQVIKQAVQNAVLPVCYRVNHGRPVNPGLVVFADAHHDRRPAAMELLYRKLKAEGSWRIVEHYLDYGQAGAGEVAKHSIRFMKLYAEAGFVVICDNFLPAASCRKRPQTKVIQLWHACGCYKKFGYDAKDDIPENYHGANVYRNADLVTVSGEAAVKPFASAMRLPEKCVKPVGVSRTDLYFRESWKERCRKQFCERYPQAKGKKVVLWAPTFRGNAGVPELISLDLWHLQRELGEEYLVLARLHPHMLHGTGEAGAKTTDHAGQPGADPVHTGQTAAGRFLCDIPTEELYPVVDILIADYSSLIYEYLLVGKELVLYVPDLESYRRRRGFYMQIEEIPGEVVTRESDLAAAVRRAAKGRNESGSGGSEAGHIETGARGSEDGYKEARHKEAVQSRPDFLHSYMVACDEHATERIAAWMTSHK